MRRLSPLLVFGAACGSPACPDGEEFDVQGLCVPVVIDTAADSGGGDTGGTGESGDTGDSDSGGGGDTGETGDSGDTGQASAPREVVELVPFDTTMWLGSGAAWRGLSVAPDGTVWAASSEGLLHLLPASGEARVYTTADGLFADDVSAVLAHSDGTVWVGFVGTVDHQGDQLAVAVDGTLSVLRVVDYDESSELTSVYRIREQPYGVGAGDVWMATNEGLCLWDADVEVFAEHAHPAHPHLITRGVAFTPEADVWSADQYQLGRWRYSNDGDLSPSADLYEKWVPWPVEPEVPVDMTDADAHEATVWLASSLFGLARVDVAEAGGASITTLYAELGAASAVRVADERTVVVGSATGLWAVDAVDGSFAPLAGAESISGSVQQLARVEPTGDGTFWAAVPGKLVQFTLSPAR